MMGFASLLLVSGLVCFAVERGCCSGAPVRQRFPLGAIGCLFTTQLCGPEEECVDDRLFGTCQQLGRARDLYKYLLDRGTLEVLEGEIWALIQQGFSWGDPYTQCILQNVLVAYREQRDFDKAFCSDVTSWSEDTEDEITQVLRKLFTFYDQQSQSSESMVDPMSDVIPLALDDLSDPEYLSNSLDSNSQKRDEFLKIHKYFAPSQPKWKRRFDPSSARDPYEEYLSNAEEERVPSLEMDNEVSNYADFSQDDLNNLQYYLQELQRLSPDIDPLDQSEEEILPSSQIEDDPFLPGEESSSKGSEEGGGAFWSSPGITYSSDEDGVWQDTPPPLAGVDLGVLEEPSSDNVETIPMDTSISAPDDTLDQGESTEEIDSALSEKGLTPRYAKLLADLLQDKLDPSKLSDDDLTRLTNIVNTLLKDLANREDSIVAETADMTNRDESIIPLSLTAEDMSSGEDGKGETPSAEENVMMKKDNGPAVNDATVDDEPKDTIPDNQPEEKPAASEDLGIVDANFAYLTVDKDIDLKEGVALVARLAQLLHVLPTNFTVDKVENGKVTFRINSDLLRVHNASSIVTAASAHKDELAKLTGLNVVGTGVGDQDEQVEILAKDTPKYFVLTFVLCGCIAGVLIAVVVLYLVKRHSRSKDKLAQLATQGDGTEASNDYQDLCRQRMQSKSSEKPEPLHAAGRIGSVSESQVRSPSSRSSTSSWSEEPVSSNMDISTGHIVLSYMEDHLKNKDRLSREWEALEAYEADPCSTIVASDPANTRKNRYTDILPYDHSRVVLADSSNVSGSDYINATTITDHDPRNPAYLSSQGPLPHTVADFWQMVWEQGSVVIVMLTKLTENGAAMCHRYWPEEGSDLYHIYEVHLVSEHIWCDDYLVRSFYLKNLQTNETRTVTQFHFLTWPDNKVPGSVKALLDFRRKVNKSYRGRSCPIAVHCSDGAGRTGTYTLIDMVLNRLAKGAKEIDIAATLEHIRDQRMGMVKTKEQFEFALAAVAEEVHAILKSLPQ